MEIGQNRPDKNREIFLVLGQVFSGVLLHSMLNNLKCAYGWPKKIKAVHTAQEGFACGPFLSGQASNLNIA